MNPAPNSRPPRRRPPRGLRPGARAQRGSVLLIALLMLAISLMLGGAALESSMVQEKLTANSRDRLAAMESQESTAKSALDNLRMLIGTTKPLPDNSPGYYVSRAVVDESGSMQANADTASLAFWMSTPLNAQNSMQANLPATNLVSQQGRYLIEHVRFDDESEPGSPTIYQPSYKTIVVVGRGANGGEVTSQTTLVMLPR